MYTISRLPTFFRALPRQGCKGRAMFFYLHRGNSVFCKVHGLEVSSRIMPTLQPQDMPVVMVETHNFQSLDANGCNATIVVQPDHSKPVYHLGICVMAEKNRLVYYYLKAPPHSRQAIFPYEPDPHQCNSYLETMFGFKDICLCTTTTAGCGRFWYVNVVSGRMFATDVVARNNVNVHDGGYECLASGPEQLVRFCLNRAARRGVVPKLLAPTQPSKLPVLDASADVKHLMIGLKRELITSTTREVFWVPFLYDTSGIKVCSFEAL